MINSNNMEAIISEIQPHTESKWYKHRGEEIHIVLEGRIEYIVGDISYKLSEGDILWHRSSVKHKAKNNYEDMAKYITIGTPPTFIPNDV
jgi:quercetin dioxygenase-like cupin family protein